VALTFDDGPGDATPAVLDVLAREHVHATFFVVGGQVALRPDLVRRASVEGHLIGNHTYDHVYPRDLRHGWTSRYLAAQLGRTAALVHRATGRPTCWFRPPGGFLPKTLLPAARRMRMTTALWTVDTRDWHVQGALPPGRASERAKQSGRIVSAAVRTVGDPHPIVLMHDGGGYRGSTAAAVSRVIAWYRAHGYTFVRLDGRV
jgi:peptidoglycan/xylan/chitin deacetylase (PgdA/CDA1 family)